MVAVSGNYKTSQPQKTGTGWRISDEFNPATITDYWNATAPRWAVGAATWRYTTLSEHLDTYQRSSRYSEATK